MKFVSAVKRPIAGAALVSVALFGATISVFAGVTPPSVESTLERGGSINVTKTVETPSIPPILDFCLLVDNSGSYNDDIATIKTLAPGIFGDVRSEVADSEFCLATFVDFPVSPYGVSGDYPYQLDQDLTGDQSTWVGAVNAMSLGYGGDGPESQLEALNRMAVGPDAPAWRTNATKVIAITTDASFHDSATEPAYPGPAFADVIANLTAQGIKVIAIKAPGATTQMDDIANATGGSVQSTSSSSEGITEAIITGLSNLPVTVTPVPVGCDPLEVTFDPASSTVVSGATATFDETITVPDDASVEGTTIECHVDFQVDGGSVIGTQTISITVPDTTAPEVGCVETVNPNGNNVPRAGQQSPGQNEDGFYQLLATDNVDDSVEIWVTSTGPSGATFGPFASGDNVKITQADGAEPKSQSIGGPNSAVAAHLILDGDAEITAIDAADNESIALCLVPRQPK